MGVGPLFAAATAADGAPGAPTGPIGTGGEAGGQGRAEDGTGAGSVAVWLTSLSWIRNAMTAAAATGWGGGATVELPSTGAAAAAGGGHRRRRPYNAMCENQLYDAVEEDEAGGVAVGMNGSGSGVQATEQPQAGLGQGAEQAGNGADELPGQVLRQWGHRSSPVATAAASGVSRQQPGRPLRHGSPAVAPAALPLSPSLTPGSGLPSPATPAAGAASYGSGGGGGSRTRGKTRSRLRPGIAPVPYDNPLYGDADAPYGTLPGMVLDEAEVVPAPTVVRRAGHSVGGGFPGYWWSGSGHAGGADEGTAHAHAGTPSTGGHKRTVSSITSVHSLLAAAAAAGSPVAAAPAALYSPAGSDLLWPAHGYASITTPRRRTGSHGSAHQQQQQQRESPSSGAGETPPMQHAGRPSAAAAASTAETSMPHCTMYDNPMYGRLGHVPMHAAVAGLGLAGTPRRGAGEQGDRDRDLALVVKSPRAAPTTPRRG